MIEQQIQAIKDKIRQLMSQIMAMGEEPPEEVQELLQRVIEKATNDIKKLRAQQAQEEELEQAEAEQAQVAETLAPAPEEAEQKITGEPIPPLEPMQYPSSNINAFRYEPKSEKLYVKFQGKFPMQNGPVYSYEGVPKYIVDVFSRGAVAPKTSGKNKWHTWKKGVTPSHGAAMFALIKSGAFPYKKLR